MGILCCVNITGIPQTPSSYPVSPKWITKHPMSCVRAIMTILGRSKYYHSTAKKKWWLIRCSLRVYVPIIYDTNGNNCYSITNVEVIWMQTATSYILNVQISMHYNDVKYWAFLPQYAVHKIKSRNRIPVPHQWNNFLTKIELGALFIKSPGMGISIQNGLRSKPMLSKGNILSNLEVSVLFHRPVLNRMDEMCQSQWIN